MEMSELDTQSLIATLRRILPPGAVLHEPEDLRPYECDGLSAYRALPLAVCLPETMEQVREVLRACYRANVAVVARGAGTGLSGDRKSVV